MPRSMRLVPLLLAVFACGDRDADVASTAAADPPPPAQAVKASAQDDPAPARDRRERPLPNFSGWSLDDQKIEVSSLLGKRLLLFFFNPETELADSVADAVSAVAPFQAKHNFQIAGVGVGSRRETIESFVQMHGIDFPVIDDSGGTITRKLDLRSPVVLIGADGEGFMTFGFAQFPAAGEDTRKMVEGQLRTVLRLPSEEPGPAPSLGERPPAPTFSGAILGSDERFDLAAHEGRAVVLIFFLHSCPHCHEALGFLKEQLAQMPEETRPVLVGVEITGRTAAVRESLRQHDLDFFPVLFDDDGSIRESYGVFAGVPETFIIDREGRISSHVSGWEPRRDAALMRMRLARAAGAPVPMLLRAKGYSGSEVCGVCHETQHETWLFTRHSQAFDTLVKHSADSDAECVSCHVVGYGKPGGYTHSPETADLENVGCESCHGRGGPHLSPDFLANGSYAETCAGCHDAKHSLGFDYATFLPRISHAAKLHLTKLPLAEKQKLLGERASPSTDLLPSRADHVGSDACRSCHEAEYATWAASPHARAVQTLAPKEATANADCLRCHTTGFGKGGFPKGGAVGEHAAFAAVGCESCHGAGGDHVAEAAQKRGTILSLGDKCDSCVILQICGSCHDDANDPGFEFAVQEKIDAQRHGTIEAGTGKPLGKSAARAPLRDEALAAHAFALLGER